MKNLLFIFILFIAFGCGKDDEVLTSVVLENETISGTVSDVDGLACCSGISVSVIKKLEGIPFADTLATKLVAEDGAYLFDNLLPNQNNLFLVLNGATSLVSAGDSTPDGDQGEELTSQNLIAVFLNENEHDDGNDFVISTQNCGHSFIHGQVFSVLGQDTTDLPEEVTIDLYSTDENGNLLDLRDSKNVKGFFSFSISNFFRGALVLDYQNTSLMPIALNLIDESPDSDPTNGLESTHLPVVLENCELDADNNIYLIFDDTPASISGQALLDLDGDGQGDIGAKDQRIELYLRNSDNVPMTPLVEAINTDQAGNFEFYDIPVGEYVLYFIGNGLYNVDQGYDQDQEAGEPDNDPPQFISVNITNTSVPDANNIFLLSQMAGCNAMPMILPYPALCDTSIICTYDKLPIYVVNELGEPITTAGGLYQLVWTDLVTGESSTGDWTNYSANRLIQLTLTYPNACVYSLNYHRDCDQDLSGDFSLRTMTTGFGPTFEYSINEVLWTFDPINQTLRIDHDIMNTNFNPNLIPAGNYNYWITATPVGLALMIEDPVTATIYDLGIVYFIGGQLVIDDGIAADGIGRYFEKN